jgi:sulfoxide reductase heme-binding subunit YedZ
MRSVFHFSAPWRDHAGRFSALKAAALLALIAPAVLLLLRAEAGVLGARPITEAIHFTGDWTVRLVLLTLAVTPARVVLDWPRVLLLRRMTGVAAALYALLHLTLYAMDQNWQLWKVVSEIVLRFYLTVGFVALVLLVALAVTSTDGWQKRLRQRWKKLHKLVFPTVGLGLFHYFMQSKVDVSSAVFYTGLFVWLMLWRATPRPWQGRLPTYLALMLLSGLATAAVEVAWYAAATKVPALRVLAANLNLESWRPAWQVALAGLVLVAAVLVRRGVGRLRRHRHARRPPARVAANQA